MALFESYERREPQILAVLKEYGINSIEECKEYYNGCWNRCLQSDRRHSANLF